jgi:addiction module HigA family antidote
MTTRQSTFSPDWTVHPGASIADALNEAGLTQADAATRLKVSAELVSYLIGGRAGITAETAQALSTVLGSTPEFWLRLQSRYEAESTRLNA